MRYSNVLEVTAMTLLWAAALIWYDIAFNQHFFAAPDLTKLPSTPQVSLWIPHVGCNGRVEEVLQALRTVPWLDQIERKGVPTGAGASHVPRPETQCDLGVLAQVPQIREVNFLDIEHALRPLNVVPTTIEFGGIPHFALRAKVANLSCESCARAAMEALTPRRDPRGGMTLKWLDSKRVNLRDQTITAFVRFNNAVHIDELTRALTQAGLPPLSLHVVLE